MVMEASDIAGMVMLEMVNIFLEVIIAGESHVVVVVYTDPLLIFPPPPFPPHPTHLSCMYIWNASELDRVMRGASGVLMLVL